MSRHSKSETVAGAHLSAKFISTYVEKALAVGATHEDIHVGLSNPELIEQYVKLTIGRLKLIESKIPVRSLGFNQKSFYKKNNRFHFLEGDYDIFKEAPEEIPEFNCVLDKYGVVGSMTYYQIFKKIKKTDPFTVSETLSLIKFFVENESSSLNDYNEFLTVLSNKTRVKVTLTFLKEILMIGSWKFPEEKEKLAGMDNKDYLFVPV